MTGHHIETPWITSWCHHNVFTGEGYVIGLAWKPDPDPKPGRFRWLHKIELAVRSPFRLHLH